MKRDAAATLVRRTGRPIGRLLRTAAHEAISRAARWRSSRIGSIGLDPSVFVLRNNDLGDVLLVTPLLAALRRHFRNSEIAVGIGDWARPLLEGNPNVDTILATNAPWFNRRARNALPWAPISYLLSSPEVATLRSRLPDVAIDVLGSNWGSLLLRSAGAKLRLSTTGYAGGENGAHVTVPYDPLLHVATAALRFATLLGAQVLPPARPQIYLTSNELRQAEDSWHRLSSARVPRILVGPGAGVEARRWPPVSFAKLCKLLLEDNVCLRVVTGPGEEAVANVVASGIGGGAHADLVSPPLRQLMGLAATADLVVCNSSVLLHAAAAFDRPTLVLLGPSFTSARAHDAQWGYPGLSVSLGAEAATGNRLATPECAAAQARQLLGNAERRTAS